MLTTHYCNSQREVLIRRLGPAKPPVLYLFTRDRSDRSKHFKMQKMQQDVAAETVWPRLLTLNSVKCLMECLCPLKGVMGKGKAIQRWSDGRIIEDGLTLRMPFQPQFGRTSHDIDVWYSSGIQMGFSCCINRFKEAFSLDSSDQQISFSLLVEFGSRSSLFLWFPNGLFF